MTNGQAVIFDLDGTLTTLEVDFAALRRELGFGPGPVWETIVALMGQQRRRAERILLAAEMAGAHRCKLIPGTKDLLDELARRGVGTAILTRNCRAAVEVILSKHELNVIEVLTREDGMMKPQPGGVIELARRLGVEPDRTLVVGDYLFDIQAANRAGAMSVLFCPNGQIPDYADQADHIIAGLPDLLDLIGAI